MGTTWRIRLNRPYAAAMRPYVKLLRPRVHIKTVSRGSRDPDFVTPLVMT